MKGRGDGRARRAARRVHGIRSVEIVVDGAPTRFRRSRLASFCSRALQAAGFTAWEVAVLLCGDRRIQDLNRRFRLHLVKVQAPDFVQQSTHFRRLGGKR